MKLTKSQMFNELALCYQEQGYNIWDKIFPDRINIDLIDYLLIRDLVEEECIK